MTSKLIKIYELGKLINIDLNLEKLQKKLSFVHFPYTANAVVLTSVLVFLLGILGSLIIGFFGPFLRTSVIFITLILSVVLYIFPTRIFYTNKIMEYSEEMLRAILHLSTYIQSGSNMEYAFLETEKNLSGILGEQFRDINNQLRRKTKSSLGNAINDYVYIWNEVNSQFVKGLRLLQIASLSKEKDRERLIEETIETLLVDYMTQGKRSTEELSKKTKLLIGGGILLPILSLLGLPILAVFMPEFVRPEILGFLYLVFFPTIVLIASLSFASKRVQVDTIKMKEHKDYRPMSTFYIYIGIFIAVIFGIPAIPALSEVLSDPSGTIDNLYLFFLAWLLAAGIALAIKLYSVAYVRKYSRIWSNIQEVEEDLPFILQSFSTYYTLNTPFEKVIDGVIDDYNELGFKDHPVVKGFKVIKNKIKTTKDSLKNVLNKELINIFPSNKMRTVISQISSFERVNQESAAKAARTVRQQVVNTYKLDDYIKTLLSDTVGLIKITTSMLAPLLCAAAVVMTYAILKSTDFITEQLEAITGVLGSEQDVSLQLIDTSEVISPIFIAAIVGIYLLEIVIVLSVFQTQIETGNDPYKMISNLNSNMISFLIYTVILFGGYFFMNFFLFEAILGG